ncbi:MAG: ATP synthase F0 subunit B [Deltaproteobacteria bacterium]|nr:MAG: ATP synthase F0 subunit B [Deltaproteobacteria bacterium]
MIKLLAGCVLVLLCSGVALASGGGHHADSGVLLKDFLWRCLNFAVTVGLLAYFVTKPIRKGLAGRSEQIAASLEEAEKLRSEAEGRYAEIEKKLATASEEIAAIQQELREDGEREKERILAEATAMAEKIRSEAQKSAEMEVARARATLRAEASKMAVEIAEKLLREKCDDGDQARLVDEYIQKVGELH